MEARASRAGSEQDTDGRRAGDPTDTPPLLLVGADTDAAHKGHQDVFHFLDHS
jgi:hypothetical protein